MDSDAAGVFIALWTGVSDLGYGVCSHHYEHNTVLRKE